MSKNQMPTESVPLIWPDFLPRRTRALFYEAIGQLTVLHALEPQELSPEQAATEAARAAEITARLGRARDRYNSICNWSALPLVGGVGLGIFVPPAALAAALVVGGSYAVCAGSNRVAQEADGFAQLLTEAAAIVAPQAPLFADPQLEA